MPLDSDVLSRVGEPPQKMWFAIFPLRRELTGTDPHKRPGKSKSSQDGGGASALLGILAGFRTGL